MERSPCSLGRVSRFYSSDAKGNGCGTERQAVAPLVVVVAAAAAAASHRHRHRLASFSLGFICSSGQHLSYALAWHRHVTLLQAVHNAARRVRLYGARCIAGERGGGEGRNGEIKKETKGERERRNFGESSGEKGLRPRWSGNTGCPRRPRPASDPEA